MRHQIVNYIQQTNYQIHIQQNTRLTHKLEIIKLLHLNWIQRLKKNKRMKPAERYATAKCV